MLAKIPKAARPETRRSAEAFASFYVDQINVAFRRPGGESLLALSSSDCEACRTYANTADDFRRRGQRQTADLLEVTSATAAKYNDDTRQVNVFFEQRSVEVVDGKGSLVSRTSKGKGAFIMDLRFSKGHWQTIQIKTFSG
ncbi:DUF6318 family protein [Terracoccus luteus]|uniref:DUF6318 domain-containing protein n=1 Tax=Terracoccus luteus TaxID=53356 RepID=A0A839PSD7_9MICO|nr:DUF6318 family protein [Terracoccus luteus]MBB2987100.1 hypothetical protein [Terracoccus luteus]MCP2172751.1 hypothetical protein [Terracoccus luteus]